ncbi:LysM peptidoglycan-binding domain-containing protein [Methylobacillus gramineus]|uniref:FimV/HubP family polar landmark protein n=1 Tax=Methylobacillus gramineus TaxID=755169 RepID=UPI001CFFBDF0|nr:FimV/HubP family polar landmark protein [Methylobacillus gramineus]MCB5184546.1 LysM peptidoglycan-binding domain-containing protein [Methylobacillus gramineus]
MVHKSKLKGVTLAVLLALMPVAAGAAGLGRLTVTSGLGEPLSAEIELLSTTPDELASLTASIAPHEAYSVQGVERTALHGAIKVDVAKSANGTPVLKLTTRQAVSDPFLDMLIQVDWATGRLLREYTVLLDPPGYNNNQAQVYNGVQLPPAPVATPNSQAVAPAPANNANRNNPARNNTARKPAPAPIAAPAQPQPAAASYTTARGDTLSAIAQQNQVEGVSLDQMLVGLYRANEDAFAGNNMNRLKVGQILRVPTTNELQAISQQQASKEVRVQSSDWNAYRNRLAGLATESTASPDTSAQSASGRISAAATDKSAAADNAPRDVVKLSRSDAKGIKAEQDRVNALQEELTAKDKSLAEAADRTAMLEKQISDMQKLLAIKNQSLANLQNNTAVPPQEVKPADVPPPAPVPEGKPEAEVKPPAADEAAPAPEEPAAPETKKPPVVVPPAPAAAEPSLVDEIIGDDPLLPALAGGALVLLLGAWLFMRNKRKRELDSFEKGIQTSGGLKANTVFGNTAGATINTGDTSFLTDFSQNTGGMIDTHDVDPIAEAEVYMAYGRDAQAEEILKDAIVKEPQRHELHVKLLEIYAARHDTSAFETVAGEIYTTLGASDPIWAKVAEMGHKLEPENPLYTADRDAKPVTTLSAAPADGGKLSASDFSKADELDAGAAVSVAGAALAGATIANALDDADQQADDDLDAGLAFTAEPAFDTSSSSLPDLDFDFDPSSPAPDVSTALHEVSDADAELDMQDNAMDFSIDLPEPAAKSSLQLDIAELDAAIPDFDLPELSMPAFSAAEPDVPAFSVPEFETGEIQSAELEPALNPQVELDDLPEIDLPAIELPAPGTQADSLAADNELPSIDFDLPEISFGDNVVDAPGSQLDEPASSDFPSLDVADSVKQAEEGIEEITLESPVDQNDSVPHFNFDDIDLESGDSVQADTRASADEIALPEFDIDGPDDAPGSVADIDLSGISLDVADGQTGTESLDTGSSIEESADVDTKLDLVTAYMDMGDNEGARELLEEILQEGGPNQKQKAKTILDGLA